MFSLIRRIFNGRDGFTPEQRLVREKFDYALRSHFKDFKNLYARRFGNVLNTDQAKELCAEYSLNPECRIRFSRCVYAPAKAFINRLFAERIQERGLEHIVFLAGGAGSGKSTALEGWRKNGALPLELLVVDGTLSDFEEASMQVRQVERNGKSAVVIYVYCPVEKALRLAIDRAIQRGRGITIQRLAETHFFSQQSVLRLNDERLLDDSVSFQVVDNTPDRPVESDLLSIHQRAYESLDAVCIRAQSAFWNEHDSREKSGNPIPPPIARLFEQGR